MAITASGKGPDDNQDCGDELKETRHGSLNRVDNLTLSVKTASDNEISFPSTSRIVSNRPNGAYGYNAGGGVAQTGRLRNLAAAMKLSKKTNRGGNLQLNMTPMIDCVFLLLIFFMSCTQVSVIN